jgi:hypothetical protein
MGNFFLDNTMYVYVYGARGMPGFGRGEKKKKKKKKSNRLKFGFFFLKKNLMYRAASYIGKIHTYGCSRKKKKEYLRRTDTQMPSCSVGEAAFFRQPGLFGRLEKRLHFPHRGGLRLQCGPGVSTDGESSEP